jgi:long-subunit acyl-CoA synthetase (AMP-forming)
VRVAGDGEVWVSSPGFAGYLGEACSRARDGAWPTGDLGRLDADGFLHLTGRRRNVFITAYGRNVAPEWVERELTLEVPVAQAAVFGEARAFNVAVLVPSPGADGPQLAAAVARANRTLPDYARVTRWLAADAAFSSANGLLTGTGRVRRDTVLERYRDRIESLYRQEIAS